MPSPDLEVAVEVVEEIMTQHWRPGGCRCWICHLGRVGNMRARSRYMRHLRTRPERGYVHVDLSPNTMVHNSLLPGNGGGDI